MQRVVSHCCSPHFPASLTKSPNRSLLVSLYHPRMEERTVYWCSNCALCYHSSPVKYMTLSSTEISPPDPAIPSFFRGLLHRRHAALWSFD